MKIKKHNNFDLICNDDYKLKYVYDNKNHILTKINFEKLITSFGDFKYITVDEFTLLYFDGLLDLKGIDIVIKQDIIEDLRNMYGINIKSLPSILGGQVINNDLMNLLLSLR